MYAAFDMDNTLLIDDIGESSFALLAEKGMTQWYSWHDYQSHIERNRTEAYNKVIAVMNGQKVSDIERVIHEVLERKEPIDVGTEKIQIPRANPIMLAVIHLLKSKWIEVIVVTASHEIAGRITCKELLWIEAQYVIWAHIPTTVDGILNFDMKSEIPYAQWKVNALKSRFFGRPIVTGWDGLWDKYLLDYTVEWGVRLWLGNKENYAILKESLFQGKDFFEVGRG
jgi:phosphoserine phosphatase